MLSELQSKQLVAAYRTPNNKNLKLGIITVNHETISHSSTCKFTKIIPSNINQNL